MKIAPTNIIGSDAWKAHLDRKIAVVPINLISHRVLGKILNSLAVVRKTEHFLALVDSVCDLTHIKGDNSLKKKIVAIFIKICVGKGWINNEQAAQVGHNLVIKGFLLQNPSEEKWYEHTRLKAEALAKKFSFDSAPVNQRCVLLLNLFRLVQVYLICSNSRLTKILKVFLNGAPVSTEGVNKISYNFIEGRLKINNCVAEVSKYMKLNEWDNVRKLLETMSEIHRGPSIGSNKTLLVMACEAKKWDIVSLLLKLHPVFQGASANLTRPQYLWQQLIEAQEWNILRLMVKEEKAREAALGQLSDEYVRSLIKLEGIPQDIVNVLRDELKAAKERWIAHIKYADSQMREPYRQDFIIDLIARLFPVLSKLSTNFETLRQAVPECRISTEQGVEYGIAARHLCANLKGPNPSFNPSDFSDQTAMSELDVIGQDLKGEKRAEIIKRNSDFLKKHIEAVPLPKNGVSPEGFFWAVLQVCQLLPVISSRVVLDIIEFYMVEEPLRGALGGKDAFGEFLRTRQEKREQYKRLEVLAEGQKWDELKKELGLIDDLIVHCQSVFVFNLANNLLVTLCKGSQWELVESLMKKKAILRTTNGYLTYNPKEGQLMKGLSPFTMACNAEKWEIAKLMLEKDPVKLDDNTALHGDETDLLGLLTTAKQWELVRLICKDAQKIEFRPRSGKKSPIYLACQDQKWDLVKLFLEKGVNIDFNENDKINKKKKKAKSICDLISATNAPSELLSVFKSCKDKVDKLAELKTLKAKIKKYSENLNNEKNSEWVANAKKRRGCLSPKILDLGSSDSDLKKLDEALKQLADTSFVSPPMNSGMLDMLELFYSRLRFYEDLSSSITGLRKSINKLLARLKKRSTAIVSLEMRREEMIKELTVTETDVGQQASLLVKSYIDFVSKFRTRAKQLGLQLELRSPEHEEQLASYLKTVQGLRDSTQKQLSASSSMKKLEEVQESWNNILQDKIKKFQQSIEALKEMFEKKIGGLSNRESSMRAKHEAANRKIADLEADKRRLQKELEAMQRQLADERALRNASSSPSSAPAKKEVGIPFIIKGGMEAMVSGAKKLLQRLEGLNERNIPQEMDLNTMMCAPDQLSTLENKNDFANVLLSFGLTHVRTTGGHHIYSALEGYQQVNGQSTNFVHDAHNTKNVNVWRKNAARVMYLIAYQLYQNNLIYDTLDEMTK